MKTLSFNELMRLKEAFSLLSNYEFIDLKDNGRYKELVRELTERIDKSYVMKGSDTDDK